MGSTTAACEGRAQRSQVAGAVVDEGNAAHRRPFVELTPARAGSGAQAVRRASAIALKAASARWWSSSPSTRTCRPMRPRRANVSRKWGAGSSGTCPTRSSRRPSSMRAMPRPERSIVALRQGLVERRAARRRSGVRPTPIAERLVEGLAQRDRAVLERVVLVDPEIARAMERRGRLIHQNARAVKQVVEEAEAGRHACSSGPVEQRRHSMRVSFVARRTSARGRRSLARAAVPASRELGERCAPAGRSRRDSIPSHGSGPAAAARARTSAPRDPARRGARRYPPSSARARSCPPRHRPCALGLFRSTTLGDAFAHLPVRL